MHLRRIEIKNFRNLAAIDLLVHPGMVVVGQNKTGKSNLLHAIRLVLDGSLSYADRQLGIDDFWDGLKVKNGKAVDPMTEGEVIEITVELAGFDGDPKIISALKSAIISTEPAEARLTYRFAPLNHGQDEPTALNYRGAVYGGENLDHPISSEFREYVHMLFMHALRDVESDIRNWRKSPLRSLLLAAAAAVPAEKLGAVKTAMSDANSALNALEQIKDLGESIAKRLNTMVGETQAVQTELAAAPDDPLRLIRNMRVYIDGDVRRPLTSASVGTLNIMYLALHELGLDSRLLDDAGIAHIVMAIEEPEAHLHPQLQRLIFGRFLGDERKSKTVLVTTQSPYIASVADPKSLVVLREVEGESRVSVAADADLSEVEWDDVQRYLDATRAEMVFARKVLFVEGFAEQVLIPRLAAAIDLDLDKLGISVCAIHGTHFGSYLKFCNALGIPWAVLTDGDPNVATGNKAGSHRARTLMDILNQEGSHEDAGIFVGETTLEFDLLGDSRNVRPCFAALQELLAAQSAVVVGSWGHVVPDRGDFMRMIDRASGKGRYAQRLARRTIYPPAYMRRALTYLSNK